MDLITQLLALDEFCSAQSTLSRSNPIGSATENDHSCASLLCVLVHDEHVNVHAIFDDNTEGMLTNDRSRRQRNSDWIWAEVLSWSTGTGCFPLLRHRVKNDSDATMLVDVSCFVWWYASCYMWFMLYTVCRMNAGYCALRCERRLEENTMEKEKSEGEFCILYIWWLFIILNICRMHMHLLF